MTLKDKVLKHGERLAEGYETVVAPDDSWCERYADYNKGFIAAVELLWPLVKANQFYSDMAVKGNHSLIFDNETESRAAVYERYKKYSIGDFGVKAQVALADLEKAVGDE